MVLQKINLDANDMQDMVVCNLGKSAAIVPYQSAFDIAQALRVHAKTAARFHRAPASFWRELDSEDPRETAPGTHRAFRRSNHRANVKEWQVASKPPLVRLIFDGHYTEFDYEEAVKLSQRIRGAAFRAKAWAGDTSRQVRMVGLITDAEDDDRLGIH